MMLACSVSVSYLLTLAPFLLQSTLAQASGTFDLLTYNVAGLPAFLNDNSVPGDKATNANLIGSKFAEYDYDVIHVQEDFNYHAYIYETDNHAHRTPTSGGVPFGSGLNTLANYNWNAFRRITWDQCFINDGDCLTPKGFTFMRLQLEGGAEVDLYNLHGDAGSETGDTNARRAGIVQIINYVESNSAGRAVIIAGDTNDRYTNKAVSITLLISEAGFTDSWIELINHGIYPTPGGAANPCGVPAASNNCEVVDKVLYRSGDSVSLSALSWSYESANFLQPDGNILSDHNPIRVEFSWSAV